VIARKGAAKFFLEITGRAAHPGNQPEVGRSAVLAMAHKICALHAMTDLAEGTTVNVGVVRGGERSNVVADRCYTEIDLRAWTPPAVGERRLGAETVDGRGDAGRVIAVGAGAGRMPRRVSACRARPRQRRRSDYRLAEEKPTSRHTNVWLSGLPHANLDRVAIARFEWDAKKDAGNQRKHGVSFVKAQFAFADTSRVIAEDLAHNGVVRIFGAGYWRRGKAIYERENQIHR
jgi:hypothetical protein